MGHFIFGLILGLIVGGLAREAITRFIARVRVAPQ